MNINKVRFLKYVGSKSEGIITVKKLRGNHPFRKFPYSASTRLRIHEQIPEKIADLIVTQCPNLFQIEVENLGPVEAYRDQVNLLMCNFFGEINLDEMIVATNQELMNFVAPKDKRIDSFKIQFECLLGTFPDLNPDDIAKIMKQSMKEHREHWIPIAAEVKEEVTPT